MKVELVNRTTWALETLLYTKNTRLQGEQSFEDVIAWSDDKKREHLAYMKDTIQSSWEFVDYTFEISGVTRAFTHQLVRTRTGSYAQESQRTVDVSDHKVVNTSGKRMFAEFADQAMENYRTMVEDNDIPIQDARGILPTNVTTSIIAKFNLRDIHNMALLRLCYRTQGEYQRVFELMRDCIVEVHPWAKDFIKVHCAWYGSCAFPRYKECPVKWDNSDVDDAARKLDYARRWNRFDHEAVPVAKEGMTQ